MKKFGVLVTGLRKKVLNKAKIEAKIELNQNIALSQEAVEAAVVKLNCRGSTKVARPTKYLADAY